MFKEDQHTEFKRLWKDEYLREICAFANSDGGTLYVGVEDDGTIVGVKDVSKLLENLPNKIKNNLHFTAVVDRKIAGDKEYIAIVVKPQDSPVLYGGRCFVRSGSTVQELREHELIAFIKGDINFRTDVAQRVAINNNQDQSSKKPNVFSKETKVAEKPKVDTIEEREHPSLWGKLFKFEELSNEELKSVIAEVCRLIREGETPTSFVEYISAVINLCAVDELMSLPQDMWEHIVKNLLKYIEWCSDKEELFEQNAKFQGIFELLKNKTNNRRLQEIIAAFRERYEWLYANSKDKMTLFLENMSDDTIGDLYEIYNGAVPDHTTPYNMTGIFQNVEIDKVYAALCRLSNAARERFAEFLERRYSIVYRVVDCGWYMHEEEVEPLRVLKKMIDDNIGQFELNDKRAMRRLSDCLGKAVRRCQGDRSNMMA